MLAVSEDKGAAQLMGINVDGTIALPLLLVLRWLPLQVHFFAPPIRPLPIYRFHAWN